MIKNRYTIGSKTVIQLLKRNLAFYDNFLPKYLFRFLSSSDKDHCMLKNSNQSGVNIWLMILINQVSFAVFESKSYSDHRNCCQSMKNFD